MHAQNWNRRQDLTGWWLSEKMDGIRAYWDGKKLYSRRGNEIPAPSSFTRNFPNVSLDGELWLGRGTLERLVGILNSTDSDWSQMKYVLFDFPGSKQNYQSRLKEMSQFSLPPNIQIVNFIKCEGAQHLSDLLKHVTSQGGEGLMAMEPNSIYTIGRTSTFLKVKVFSFVFILTLYQWYDDTEVRLLEILPTGFKCEQYFQKSI